MYTAKSKKYKLKHEMDSLDFKWIDLILYVFYYKFVNFPANFVLILQAFQ